MLLAKFGLPKVLVTDYGTYNYLTMYKVMTLIYLKKWNQASMHCSLSPFSEWSGRKSSTNL